MSRKTIAFQLPKQVSKQVPPAAPRKEPSRALARLAAPGIVEAEHWVSRNEPTAETSGETPAPKAGSRAATITLTLSAEPDLFEVASIGLLLPAAFLLWGLAATHKSLQLFSR
ncbi:hypothetical protein [uncultured Rhodoblastus sp.]|uniref:hypothetical protein n=1 Tax=uncultured Rhodoblastus sp. TaxID=543037 RepID=UPI0025CDFFF0|nr:hypothetical protein [uncultured Rhodoblastus sp.]